MMFFKSAPNLPDNGRARIEYYLQRIAESIGIQRCKLPVLAPPRLLYQQPNEPADYREVGQLKDFAGRHLGFDFTDVQVQTFPMQLQKIGGGG